MRRDKMCRIGRMMVCGCRALDGGISPFLSCGYCFRVIRATAPGEFEVLKSLMAFSDPIQRSAKNLPCTRWLSSPMSILFCGISRMHRAAVEGGGLLSESWRFL
jgi:hypothetical protein